VDVYIASEARVGADIIQQACPAVKFVQICASHQEILRPPHVTSVAAALTTCGQPSEHNSSGA